MNIFRRWSSSKSLKATSLRHSGSSRSLRRSTGNVNEGGGEAMTPIMRSEDPVEDFGPSSEEIVLKHKQQEVYLKQQQQPKMTSIQTLEELHDIINALAASQPPRIQCYDDPSYSGGMYSDYDDDDELDEDDIKRQASMVNRFRKLLNAQKPQEAYALISEDIHDIQKHWDLILPMIRNH